MALLHKDDRVLCFDMCVTGGVGEEHVLSV